VNAQRTTPRHPAAPEQGDLAGRDGRKRQLRAAQALTSPGLRSRATRWARANWLLLAAIGAGLAARIVFWAVTDRRLDDALITIKFAKNAADGLGLVHNLGDGHVYGFTSALSVLVPLPGEFIAHGGGLLLLRLASLVAFGLAALYAYRIGRELRLGAWPMGFALAYLALDQDEVFYGMAGMETQIAVAVLLAGIYYVLVEDYVKSGVALGLALLARPDFVLWVAPAYLFLLVRDPRRALGAGLVSAAVVGPWVIFTTLYYGSPIPNTIVAKSLAFTPDFPSLTHPVAWIDFLGHQLSAHRHDWMTAAPFLERVFVLHTPLPYGLLRALTFGVIALAVIGVISTVRRPSWRPAIAFVALFALYKVVFLTAGYFEWYGVPALSVLILLAAAGLDRVTSFAAAAARGRFTLTRGQLAAVPAICLALAYAIQLPYTIPMEARVQHDVEDQVRTPLGEYLGRAVKPGQSITSESSGYVGYYTNGTFYDFPGLVSTTVVDAVRRAGDAYNTTPGVAKLLHPDWLVLRPGEADYMRSVYPGLARQYRPVHRFATSDASGFLRVGGLTVFNVDERFIVFRRKPPQPPPPNGSRSTG
jgi:hypothetical protein